MPVSKPKSPPKRGAKGKKVTPKKGPSKSVTQRSKAKQPAPQPVRIQTVWQSLSIDRKLDVVGIGLSLTGLLTLLGIISAQRSAPIAKLIGYLEGIFGWGAYILPAGLIVIGVWLVLRNLESIPTISAERVTGVVLLYFWLLTVLHAVFAGPTLADQAAMQGDGGGYLGSVFVQILWFGLGSRGAVLALIAWLLIGLALTLDVSIGDLFQWVSPLASRVGLALARLVKPSQPKPTGIDLQANGYTPIQRPPASVMLPQPAISPNGGVPVTTSSGRR